ncbi:MAG: COX15/CtaA family protein [Actinomycetota bacterium]|nr:COX15/CtaA family protein [Actinomycetota bacterium]
MPRFHRIAVLCLAATFALVSIGGLVRATKSGLGCGDNWPDCPGNVDRALIIEMSHRGAAAVVVVLLAILAVLAWRRRHEAPGLLVPSVAAFGLVLFQAVLGAVVVWLRLRAESVVLHLGAAMALLVLLVYITAASSPSASNLESTTDARTARRGRLVALAVLLLLLAGSYVTGRDAGYVFGDWPLMNGRLVPDLSIEPYALHFFHRALAGVVGIALFMFCAGVMRRKREFPLQARLAHVAAGAFALEVLVGAANIWTRLNPAVVTLHLALGALILASVAGIAIVSNPGFAAAAARARSLRMEPAGA